MIVELVPIVDGITFIFGLCAIFILIRYRNYSTKASSRIILLTILSLVLFFSFSNMLEWSDVTNVLDQYEDVIQVMEPLFWGFLFYSFIQGFKQQELRESQSCLIEEKKVSELLLDLMTHDLINYNTVALGNMELLLELVEQDAELSKLVSEGIHSIRGSSLLIGNVRILHQLLEMREDFQLEPIRLISVIESAKEKTQGIYPAIPLELSFSPTTQDFVVAGHAILENVFINLFTNSVRYREPEQDVVSIDIEIHREESFTCVTYSDHGIGIPDKLKERIFDRFSVAPHERKGSGLGLSISKRIVEALGGDIRVTNRKESPNDFSAGVSFIIRLKSVM